MTATSTLAHLAITHPAASRVFQRYGLDYGCGGRATLADACRQRGLEPGEVLAAIEREDDVAALPRWDTAPIHELIRHIVAHYHARLRQELPDLIALAERVEAEHADQAGCPRGLSAHLQAMHGAILDHLAKEERVLFPLILEGYGARSGGPVRVMELEHEAHTRNLARVRELTNDLTPAEDAGPVWRALYLRLHHLEWELFDHIHLENNVLFPRALAEQSVQSAKFKVQGG